MEPIKPNVAIPAPPSSVTSTISIKPSGKVDVFTPMVDMQKARELYSELENQFWSRVGAANQVAINAMTEAYDAIEDAGMMKQRIKQMAKAAMSASDKYQHECQKEMGDRYYLWGDVVRIAADNIQPNVMHLYYSIKQLLDKFRIPHSDVCSHIQTALALLTSANLFCDGLIEHFQRQTFYNINKDFRKWRMTAVENNWREVARLTSRCKEDISLQDDPNCQLAMTVIFNKYEKMDFLDDAAKKAMPLNPEMAKYANEEDKKYFQSENIAV